MKQMTIDCDWCSTQIKDTERDPICVSLDGQNTICSVCAALEKGPAPKRFSSRLGLTKRDIAEEVSWMLDDQLETENHERLIVEIAARMGDHDAQAWVDARRDAEDDLIIGETDHDTMLNRYDTADNDLLERCGFGTRR